MNEETLLNVPGKRIDFRPKNQEFGAEGPKLLANLETICFVEFMCWILLKLSEKNAKPMDGLMLFWHVPAKEFSALFALGLGTLGPDPPASPADRDRSMLVNLEPSQT